MSKEETSKLAENTNIERSESLNQQESANIDGTSVKPAESDSENVDQQKMRPPMTMSSVVGDACWLLSQSPAHRYNFFIGDIAWMIMPAILNGQYKLYQSENRPVGIAFWAYVSEEVQTRLESGLGKLSGKDWKSGEHLWLIDLVVPYGQSDQIIADLQKTAFKGKTFKFHRTTKDGKREIVTIPAEQQDSK